MNNIEDLFKPTSSDVRYTQSEQLVIGLIFRLDSYKMGHYLAYPNGIKAMTSYGEARISENDVVVPFGWQFLAKRYLRQTITMDHVDAAEKFALAHFGRPLFARAAWEKVVTVYNGKLPLIIRAVPEGTIMHGKQPIYTVTVFDEDLFWLSAGFETMIQRGFWYPTTIVTMDYTIKQVIRRFYEQTGADMSMIPFSYHDFGGRGVTCAEQAEIGGASHLVNFSGSDTVEGVLAANFYYKTEMAGFSVYATEHSVECSFGGGTDDAKAYIRHQLKNAIPGSIVSIVIDGYDVYREANLLCTEFKNDIINSQAKIVFRPDSGDMLEVVPKILAMQEKAFGITKTSTGHKKIQYVGVIQGDGVDHSMIHAMLDKITRVLGYSADCVIFGSGGSLLQKVNRDTLSFAQKASAIFINGQWKGIAKDPITDSGKKSKEGVLTTAQNLHTGKLEAVRLDTGPLSDDYKDIMRLVYHCGTLYNEVTLDEIRSRVNS
jgi:nicotinamide phosphoribosyltransferase